MIAVRPSREAVAFWNVAYAEQTAAMFAATHAPAGDVTTIRRLAQAYRDVAQAWRALAEDLAAPLWARLAASVAAEEFERRAGVEDLRTEHTSPEAKAISDDKH